MWHTIARLFCLISTRMSHKDLVLLVALVILYSADKVLTQSGSWSDWKTCNDTSVCHSTRIKQCNVSGVPKSGSMCVGTNEVYEEVLSNNCTARCSGVWISKTEGICNGTCYDAIQQSQQTCSNESSCLKTQMARCYNNVTCMDFWINPGDVCSKPCGTGYRIERRRCKSFATLFATYSYNCPGTNGNITAEEIIHHTDRLCNLIPCPTWSEWASTMSCSRHCGNGVRYLSSNCSHGGQPSVLCDVNRLSTNRTKNETCNTQPCCSSWGSWSPCEEANCQGNNFLTRHRECKFETTEANSCVNGGNSSGCTGNSSLVGNFTQQEIINKTCENIAHECTDWSNWKTTQTCSCINEKTESRQRKCISHNASTNACQTTAALTSTVIENATNTVTELLLTTHQGTGNTNEQFEQHNASYLAIALGTCGCVLGLVVLVLVLLAVVKRKRKSDDGTGLYSIQLSRNNRRTRTILAANTSGSDGASSGRNSGTTTTSDSSTLSRKQNQYVDPSERLANRTPTGTWVKKHPAPFERKHVEQNRTKSTTVQPKQKQDAFSPEDEYEEINHGPRRHANGESINSLESYISMHNIISPTYESNVAVRRGTNRQRSSNASSTNPLSSHGSVSSGSSGESRERSSTQSSVTSNICYSTINPVNKETERVIHKKAKSKSGRNFQRVERPEAFSRATSLRAQGVVSVRGSSRRPQFSTITEHSALDTLTLPPPPAPHDNDLVDEYEVMNRQIKSNSSSPYINNIESGSGEQRPTESHTQVAQRHMSVEIITDEPMPEETAYNDTLEDLPSVYNDAVSYDPQENVYAGVL